MIFSSTTDVRLSRNGPETFFPPENNIGDGWYKTPVTFVFLFLYSVIITRPTFFNARREKKYEAARRHELQYTTEKRENIKRSRDETLVAFIFHRQTRTVPPLINIGEEKTKKKETWQNAGSFAGYQKVSPGTTLMQYCKFNNANPHSTLL